LRAAPENDGGGWKNFVLISPPHVVAKRKFWGAHDRDRLVRNRDIAILYEHHRPIYEWLERLVAEASAK
jgi:hypothetical protein